MEEEEGPCSAQNNWRIPRSLGSILHLGEEGKEGTGSSPGARRPRQHSLCESNNMGSYFNGIGLGIEELKPVKSPPTTKKKKNAEPQKRMAYKYRHAWKSFANLASTHSVWEVQKILIAGTRFLDLGMVKVEDEHPVPGLDRLVASLEERLPTNWDIPESSEQFIEEIGLVDYIQAMLVGPTVKTGTIPVPKATVPSTTEPMEPLMEQTSTHNNQRCRRHLLLTRVRRLIFPPQRSIAPPTKPKGIVISAPAAPRPFISKEEEEPMLGGCGYYPCICRCARGGADEEEQLARVLRVSMDTAREEQAA